LASAVATAGNGSGPGPPPAKAAAGTQAAASARGHGGVRDNPRARSGCAGERAGRALTCGPRRARRSPGSGKIQAPVRAARYYQ
jgi:hypothetical protein